MFFRGGMRLFLSALIVDQLYFQEDNMVTGVRFLRFPFMKRSPKGPVLSGEVVPVPPHVARKGNVELLRCRVKLVPCSFFRSQTFASGVLQFQVPDSFFAFSESLSYVPNISSSIPPVVVGRKSSFPLKQHHGMDL